MALGTLALAFPAHAAPPPATLWSAGVSIDRTAWLASVAWFGSKGQGLWVRRALRHQLDVGVDARALSTPLLIPGAGFEVGASLGYGPRTGVYRPRVALTGGWSGGVHFDWADYYGEGWQEQSPVSRADYRPWSAGVAVEPLAAQVGPAALRVAGVEVSQLGWARVLRIQVQLVALGVHW